jgi:DNA processing protein
MITIMDEIQLLPKADFPERLLEIPDAPKSLYYRGILPDFEENRFLAVVGSRKFSNYGKEACQKLLSGLSGYPIVVISGLALGIDAIAHESALSAGLKTLAVPGSGLNDAVLYPRMNFNLAQRILKEGGALLSEFEPDAKSAPYFFPQRNRIMAGLSHAVLIIEAEGQSGTLITARLATEYNRDVLTVPGSIFSETSAGPHLLLKLGATPIRTSEDILEALYITTMSEEKVMPSNLTPDEQRVLELLREPIEKEMIYGCLALSTSEVNSLLTMMELKGLIRESLGKLYQV